MLDSTAAASTPVKYISKLLSYTVHKIQLLKYIYSSSSNCNLCKYMVHKLWYKYLSYTSSADKEITTGKSIALIQIVFFFCCRRLPVCVRHRFLALVSATSVLASYSPLFFSGSVLSLSLIPPCLLLSLYLPIFGQFE